MVCMLSVFRALVLPIGGSLASVYPPYNWIGINRHCPKEVTPNDQQEAFATRKEGEFEFDFSTSEKRKTMVRLIQGLDVQSLTSRPGFRSTSVAHATAGAIPSTEGLGLDFGRFLYKDLKRHAGEKKIYLEIQTSPSPRTVATQEMVIKGIEEAAKKDVAGKDVKSILELNKLGETLMIAETGVYDTYMEKIQNTLIEGFRQAPEKWSQVTGAVLAPAGPSGEVVDTENANSFLETTDKESGTIRVDMEMEYRSLMAQVCDNSCEIASMFSRILLRLESALSEFEMTFL